MLITAILTAAILHTAPSVPPGCVSAYRGEPGEDSTVVRCDDWSRALPPNGDSYEPYTDQPDPLADCLIVHGYRGKPDDGAERIYAPGDVIEWCSARTDPQEAYVGPDEATSLWWTSPVWAV